MASTMLPLHAAAPKRSASPLSAGFSLTELLAVSAIAAALTAVAVPSFAGFLATQRSNGTVGRFVASLNLARSEAIKRNARAVLCKSADGATCSQTGAWDQGWIVFHDANNDGQVDAGEALVLQSAGLAAGYRLTGNTNVSRYVSYSANGSAKLLSGAFQAGTFTLCPPPGSGVKPQKVILSGTGRPRVVPGLIGDCS